MEIDDTIKKVRYVVTPTIDEVYRQEMKDLAIDITEEEANELERESLNQVEGVERLYSLLLNNRKTSVDGTEGFFGEIVNGLKAIVRMIVDFVKSLFGSMKGKISLYEAKLKKFEKGLGKAKEKSLKLVYPKSSYYLAGASTLSNNLGWTDKAISTTKKGIANLNAYSDQLKGNFAKVAVSNGNGDVGSFKEINSHITPFKKVDVENGVPKLRPLKGIVPGKDLYTSDKSEVKRLITSLISLLNDFNKSVDKLANIKTVLAKEVESFKPEGKSPEENKKYIKQIEMFVKRSLSFVKESHTAIANDFDAYLVLIGEALEW